MRLFILSLFISLTIGLNYCEAGSQNKSADLLTFLPAINASNSFTVTPLPLYSINNKGYYYIEYSNKNTATLTVNKDNTGNITSIDKIIYDIKKTNNSTETNSIVVYYNNSNIPSKIDFNDNGYIIINQASTNENSNTTTTKILSAEIHLPGTNPLNIYINKIIDNIPCMQSINNCRPVIPTSSSTTKQGAVKIISNMQFGQSDTSLDILCRGGVSTTIAYNPSGTPISAPYYNGSSYTSTNNYQIKVEQPLSHEMYITDCMGYSGCGLSILQCIFTINDLLNNLIEKSISDFMLTISTPQWQRDALKTMLQLLLRANPKQIATSIASTLVSFTIDQWTQLCENGYKLATKPEAIISATASGSLSGTVKSQPFDILTTSSLPNLTIEKNYCSSKYISGSDQGISEYIELGSNNATFTFNYETYYVKDRMIIFHGDTAIFDTNCIGTAGEKSKTLTLNPNNSPLTQIKVSVLPDCDKEYGTSWYFYIDCPTTDANKKNDFDVRSSCYSDILTRKLNESDLQECLQKEER